MRIGVRRLPRRRDPRRRFRNRLLLGMVGVALLPLVAFAVLAVFELDTVAKSTANATETAILQRQQGLQQTSVNRGASALEDKALRAAAERAIGPEVARRLGRLAAEPDEGLEHVRPGGGIRARVAPPGA